jgi:hypothetical protein
LEQVKTNPAIPTVIDIVGRIMDAGTVMSSGPGLAAFRGSP